MRIKTHPRKVLVIGGTGFLGDNLVKRLIKTNSSITIVSKSRVSGKTKTCYLSEQIKYIKGNVSNTRFIDKIIKTQDVIFNFAGHGPLIGFENPVLDLKTVCKGTLNILESCRKQNPNCRIILMSSQLDFGKVKEKKVDENHDNKPNTIYGTHRLVVTNYSKIYSDLYGLNTTVLRFSNVYGPHPMPAPKKYNIVNYFIDRALKNQTIFIYGDGQQIRDYLYVDDAINALLKAAKLSKISGQVFNLGTGKPTKFIEMANLIVRIIGKGRVKKIPWPKEYLKIETGDYVMNYFKAKKLLSWKPKVSLSEGINKTVKYHKKNLPE